MHVITTIHEGGKQYAVITYEQGRKSGLFKIVNTADNALNSNEVDATLAYKLAAVEIDKDGKTASNMPILGDTIPELITHVRIKNNPRFAEIADLMADAIRTGDSNTALVYAATLKRMYEQAAQAKGGDATPT